jgi:hypothetical protein
MRITLLLLLGTACLIGLTQCKKYTADKLPEKQIRWGFGGGFTGLETTFVLLPNGQKFTKVGQGNLEAIPRIKRSEARKIFKLLSKVDVQKTPAGTPSNKYEFMELPDGKGGFKRVIVPSSITKGDPLWELYLKAAAIKFVPPVIKKDIED